MEISILIQSAFKTARLTADDERELWREFGVEERARLIVAYQPLVASALARLKPVVANIEDCYSEGLLALIKSVDDFNPSLGAPFAAYARIRIRGAMLDLLRRQSKNARLDDAADLSRMISLASADGGDTIDQSRLSEILLAAERLAEKERSVIEMLYLGGKSREEAAAELGVSPARVSQIHGRALKRIRGIVFSRKKKAERDFAKRTPRKIAPADGR